MFHEKRQEIAEKFLNENRLTYNEFVKHKKLEQDIGKQREKIVKAWQESGILDGITGFSNSKLAELLRSDKTQKIN